MAMATERPKLPRSQMQVAGAWVPRTMIAALDALANQDGLSRSTMLARIIAEYVAAHAPIGKRSE